MFNKFITSKFILCEVEMLSSGIPNMLNIGDVLTLATVPLLHVSREFTGTSFDIVSSSDNDDSSSSYSLFVELLL